MSAPAGSGPTVSEPGLAVLLDLLDLEDLELNLFRSRQSAAPGRRLFGGQVAAQALVAAERTVLAEAAAHSLHAYFLRPGDSGAPVVFRVDRLQDGRTFRRRRVTAIQAGQPILCLESSFTADRSTADHHTTRPAAPDPAECPETDWRVQGNGLRPDHAFDLRAATTQTGIVRPFVHDLWFRTRGSIDGARVSPAAVLTYVSDLTLASVILRPSGRTDVRGMTSLDHVLWFHNEVRLDDWLLYAKTTPAAGHMRGLAQGGIFHRDGTLIASVAQEGLIHADR
ncbi:MAG TPA: acyl-CoA thioesterase domain-containing protein [Pseudonocardiaceae bacterium]|nr:acyl-CoA thioesterase domain-containing protein [Pseudonocardiaceae bacterium]